MVFPHKNKTFATFLALSLGATGAHRFYLFGAKDRWGWIHFCSLLLTGMALRVWPDQPFMFTASPVIIAMLAGFIEALVLGLTSDEHWDQRFNPNSGNSSNSGWLLAVLLVLTLGVGAVAGIAVIARTLDLLLTGGAYG